MNARFWIWWNGWTKITLRPHQRIHIDRGGPTDEGWSYHGEAYAHTGDGVVCEWFDDGVDCDGRLESGGSSFCQLEDLHNFDMMLPNPCADNEGIFAPHWRSLDNKWQRDHAAEAMGY